MKKQMKSLSLSKFSLAIAAFGLTLLIAETAAWIFFFVKEKPEYVYQYSYMNGYVYDPYIAFRMAHFPAFGNSAAMNSDSIVITGGSTAVGVGIQHIEKMYFTVLEQSLIHTHHLPSVQIVNYGVPGFVSNQEAGAYKEYIFGKNIAPKLVISFTSFNDLYFYLFRSLNVGNHEFSYAIDYVFRRGYPDPHSVIEQLRNWVRKTNLFAFQHYFRHREVNGIREPIRLSSDFQEPYQAKLEPTSEETILKAANNFLDNCLATGLLASKRGTRFVVLLQPNYFYGGELTISENEWFKTIPDLQKWIDSVGRQKPAYDKFYELVIKGLSRQKKEGILDFLDYRDKLKDAGPVFLDPVHFNSVGSKIVGESLASDLIKLNVFSR